MQQLRGVDRALLRQRKPPGTEPHFSLKVVFQGENVEGQGGPYRQFFTDVVNELRDRLPLLIPCPNAQSGVGKNRFVFFSWVGALIRCSAGIDTLSVLR